MRRNLFDIEAFKGKNQSNIKDMKNDLLVCTSEKQADYKFKKMVQKYQPDQMIR